MNDEIYICFLRGINVSGKNLIGMKELAGIFINLGFSDVTTYLQSGNVVFRAGLSEQGSVTEDLIEGELEKVTGMKIPVIVRPDKQIRAIFTGNPFISENNIETGKLYVTLLKTVPGTENLEIFLAGDYLPERYRLEGKELFLYCPEGYGRARLNNNFIEKRLGVAATTRNWNTIKNIYEIINTN